VQENPYGNLIPRSPVRYQITPVHTLQTGVGGSDTTACRFGREIGVGDPLASEHEHPAGQVVPREGITIIRDFEGVLSWRALNLDQHRGHSIRDDPFPQGGCHASQQVCRNHRLNRSVNIIGGADIRLLWC
jgi:hypothetical protein